MSAAAWAGFECEVHRTSRPLADLRVRVSEVAGAHAPVGDDLVG